jgi:hypothetical protein
MTRLREWRTRSLVAGAAGLLGATLALGVTGPVGASTTSKGSTGGQTPNTQNPQGLPTVTGIGYRLVGSDGGVCCFGALQFYGSMGGKPLNQPMVGIASLDSFGYWTVAADGGIFAYGDAPFLGSPGQINPKLAPGGANAFTPGTVVGMANDFGPTGYWEVTSNGGVYAFGGAQFYGSMAGKTISAPITGIASSGDGGGYWLIGKDGAVYAFGDAAFPQALTINGLPLTPANNANGVLQMTGVAGYGAGDNANFLSVDTTGKVYVYGPSAITTVKGQNVVAQDFHITTTVSTSGVNAGWWTADSSGGVYSGGTATFYGSLGGIKLNKPIVGIDGY